MMELLLYVSSGLIIFSYLLYLCLIIFNRRKEISELTGFDIAKNMLEEYNRINIIEGNYSFSYYNVKRRVIKLSKDDYYGNNLSAIALSSLQAGVSIVERGFVDNFKRIFPSLKVIELFGIVSLVLNYISMTVSDAKIGIVLMGIIVIIRYFYMDILYSSYNFVSDKIKKIKEVKQDKRIDVLNFINRVILCNRIQFVAELIIMVRFVMLLFNF